MTPSDWRDLLDGMPRETRIKALLCYELAADRAGGESVDVALSTLRAVATAEGLDPGQPWIPAAAAEIARRHGSASALPRVSA